MTEAPYRVYLLPGSGTDGKTHWSEDILRSDPESVRYLNEEKAAVILNLIGRVADMFMRTSLVYKQDGTPSRCLLCGGIPSEEGGPLVHDEECANTHYARVLDVLWGNQDEDTDGVYLNIEPQTEH